MTRQPAPSRVVALYTRTRRLVGTSRCRQRPVNDRPPAPSSPSRVVALYARTRRQTWSDCAATGRDDGAARAIAGGALYIRTRSLIRREEGPVAGRDDRAIRAIDAIAGNSRWPRCTLAREGSSGTRRGLRRAVMTRWSAPSRVVALYTRTRRLIRHEEGPAKGRDDQAVRAIAGGRAVHAHAKAHPHEERPAAGRE